MNEKKIKTCEEYVLNALAEKEEELEKATSTLETVVSAKIVAEDKLCELESLVREMAKHLQIRKGAGYDSLYSSCGFIGLVIEENRADEEDQFVLSLIRLADFVGVDIHAPVGREE